MSKDAVWVAGCIILAIYFKKWWLIFLAIADTTQTEEKHAICNGCVYCDLPNAFHPCASCVDFSKYVGEESGDTPQTDVYDYKGNGKWERSK